MDRKTIRALSCTQRDRIVENDPVYQINGRLVMARCQAGLIEPALAGRILVWCRRAALRRYVYRPGHGFNSVAVAFEQRRAA
jgi:hypothetical protein